MPNIASVLKAEIARVARKEARSETSPLKTTSSRHRSEIAALKREVAALKRMVKQLGKGRRSGKAADEQPAPAATIRYSAKGLASHRKRLGLSAEAFGILIGVTGQSIYKWEAGKAKPRKSQMEAIAAVRQLGRREALKQLEDAGAG